MTRATGNDTVGRVHKLSLLATTCLMASIMASIAASLTGCRSPEREGVEEVFNFSPLAYYETSEVPKGYSVDVLWPLINFDRQGDETSSRVFPLYYTEADAQRRRQLNVLLLYNQSETASGDSHMLFPVWFESDSDDYHMWHLWPLVGRYYREKDDVVTWSKTSIAWPLFVSAMNTDDSMRSWRLASFGPLFGLADYCREPRAMQSEDTELTAVESTDPSAATGASAESEQVTTSSLSIGWVLGSVFGLFDRYDDPALGERGWSFLNVLRRAHPRSSQPDIDGIDNLELAAARTRFDSKGQVTESHHHVFPLYSTTHATTPEGESSSFWLVPPLLYRHGTDSAKKASDHDLLLGLFHYGTEGEGATAATSWRALPLLWFTTRPDSRVHLVLPLYYDIRDRDSSYFHFIPFYGKNTEAGGKATTTFIVPPLYIKTRDERKDLVRTDVLYPLIASESSVGGRTHHFWPFYHYGEEGARSYLNVMVLFHRTSSEVESSTLFWPLYADRAIRGEGQRRSLFPIIDVIQHFDATPPRGDTFSVLWPLSSFQQEGEKTSNWVFPFYWWFDDHLGSSTKAIWPLYGIHRDGERATHSTLWPLFHYGSDSAGDWSDLGLLFPLGNFTHTQVGTTITKHRRFFPLFYYDSHESDSLTSSDGWFLWPLYTYDREYDDSLEWRVLWKLTEYDRNTTPDSEDFAILHALYRYHREADRVMRSVPFLFRYESDAQGSTLHLFHAIPIRLRGD